MNMIATDTTLTDEGLCTISGYTRQPFPAELKHLQHIYHRTESRISGELLDDVGFALGTLSRRYSHAPMTEDKYSWCRGLYFKIGDGMVLLLFPWRGDDVGEKEKRRIEVYTKGVIGRKELSQFLTYFCITINETFDAQDGLLPADLGPSVSKWVWLMLFFIIGGALLFAYTFFHSTQSPI
jgi:hypothetical protein